LDWYAADVTLLAIPPATIAATVTTTGDAADHQELARLFDETPALDRLSAEDRLGLASVARPVNLPPGAALALPGAEDAAIVVSGLLVRTDGAQIRAGSLLGPTGVHSTAPVGQARTAVRAWTLPAVGGLPILLGGTAHGGTAHGGSAHGETAHGGSAHGGTARSRSAHSRSVHAPAAVRAGTPPASGVHPAGGYPPLAAPPGPPPPTVDTGRDRWFERRLWWLLAVLLLFAALLTGSNLVPGPAWAEMPNDRALLRIHRGTATVTMAGASTVVRSGDERYVGRTDQVSLDGRSLARLTFRGGGYAILCAGSRIGIGPLSSPGTPARPSAELRLAAGRLLADTASTSPAFRPVHLLVDSARRRISNDGPARFAADAGAVTAAAGRVAVDGLALPTTGGALACGDGSPVEIAEPVRPAEPGSVPSTNGSSPAVPTGSGFPPPGPTRGSARPSLSQPPTAAPSTRPGNRPTTGAPGTPPSAPPTSATPTTGPPPPPQDTTRPAFRVVLVRESGIRPPRCTLGVTSTVLTVGVSDPGDPPQRLTLSAVWSIGDRTVTIPMRYTFADLWEGTVGPFTFDFPDLDTEGTITVTATDPAGNRATASTPLWYRDECGGVIG
jgi:putative peptide zinc metalloprotease protein